MVLYVKLWQGIHEGLKKLEGGKDYTMEELLIRHWAYGEDLKEAGRVLVEVRQTDMFGCIKSESVSSACDTFVHIVDKIILKGRGQ